MSKGKNQYVVPTEDGWGVRGQGNSKITVKNDTKAEALKLGTQSTLLRVTRRGL
jgi:hypothetical protein